MLFNQKFLPSDAFSSKESTFYRDSNELFASETKLQEYMLSLLGDAELFDIYFTDEEKRSLQIGSALIDVLTKTSFDTENISFPTLARGQHVFNVSYAKSPEDESIIQFANAPYLEHIGMNIKELLNTSRTAIEKILYSEETIRNFTLAAQKTHGYTSRYIEMDNVSVLDGESRPAYYWYRKEFNHPEGGVLQIRLGMNGTGLTLSQREELSGLVVLTNALRSEYPIENVYYTNPSYKSTIDKIVAEIQILQEKKYSDSEEALKSLSWMKLILEVSDDIMRNSPFPITILGGDGTIEQISPAYSVAIGRDIDSIMHGPSIYSGIEKDFLQQNLDYYAKNGRYVEGTSFSATRGTSFGAIEENLVAHENGVLIPRHVEMIPKPFPIGKDNGTVRLNTVHPELKF